MKIAVIGSGAIGSVIAGYLSLKGEDVSLVGHADSVAGIKKQGLNISGVRGNFHIDLKASQRIEGKQDLAILTVKTQDCQEALKDNIAFLLGTPILATQNGIGAEAIVAKYVSKENIISSIVMFGATYLEPGAVVHNFEGNWIIGRFFGKNDAGVEVVSSIIKKIFPVTISDDMRGMKYMKLFVNANNCIPAILGISMQEAFSDPEISRISLGVWREGLGVVKKSGIGLVSLPDFPLERLLKLASLPPEEAAKIFSGIMMNLSKEPLYGSILQSIRRNRPSEIDYINGEFVRLAKENGFLAPLNLRLVEMVHRIEREKRFFSKPELLEATGGMFN